MKPILISFLSIIVYSCNSHSKNDFKREVYLGFSLGSGKVEAGKHFTDLVANNTLKRYRDDAYYENSFIGKKYYSTFSYNIPSGDTLVTGLTVQYSIALDDNFYMMCLAMKGGDQMYIQLEKDSPISDNEVTADIVSQIDKKYESHILDTVFLDGTLFKTFSWENKDGVDIEVEHKTRDMFDNLDMTSKHYYQIRLTYKFNEKLRSSLPENKSVY